ncbi:MAG: sigma-70 region 4 domain-containing protein [Cyclobacteriaceae bacterium]|nr:sigma-70 region 4 domain-containing protein [Cyclobacteriaceae bacterium]
MANTLDPMDIKQIFTLYTDGLSNRNIAEILGISRNTINQYINWLKSSDYTANELLGMDIQAVRELFPSHKEHVYLSEN